MVELAGVLVGLIFVAAVAGLIAVNDLVSAESSQSASNSEIKETLQTSQNEIVRTLIDMDAKIVLFFSDLKEDLGIL